MPIHKVARLLITLDDVSGTLTVAARPSGQLLPTKEWQFTNLSSPPVVRIDQVNQRVSDGLLNLAAHPTFQVTTEWHLNGARIVRRFLTPVKALAQRMECFDIHYTFETPKGLNFAPLLFAPPCTASQSPTGYVVRADSFVITLRVSVTPPGQIVLGPTSGSGGFEVRVNSTGCVEASLSFLIASAHQIPRDTAIHILPPALDGSTFVVVALTPAVLPSLLSACPAAKLCRASPLMLLSGATGVQPAGFWASLFESGIRGAAPPAFYPYGDLIRMSDVIFYHSHADSDDDLTPTIAYLKTLGPGKLPSTQLIVALSADGESYARLQRALANVGKIKLLNIHAAAPVQVGIRQLQPHGWSDLPALLAQIDRDMDALNWSGKTRKSFRQQFALSPLDPVPVPPGEDPLGQAPFLAAARLRGNAAFTSGPDAWPLPLKERKPARVAAEVARYVLADLQTHEALRAAGAGGSYAATWKQRLMLIDKGEARADRLIFAVVSGADARYDRLKLLPPILYSGHVPSPVFPMRVALPKQQKIVEQFSEHMKDVADYWVGVHSGGATSSAAMDKSSRGLQDCFQGEEWAALRDLVELVKPKEFINFSALPIEWWEIDGVPLGQLTKVVTLHSQTLESDAGVCADLPTIYNSLVMTELTPASTECRVLVIAPRYDGVWQEHVNATIDGLKQVLADELRAAQAAGREVLWNIVQPRTPADVKARLEERWSLLIYVGHASEGVLCLPAGELSPRDFPEQAMLGVTSVLIGCDTKGASNLSRSVASRMMSVGARAVFSTFFTLPLTMSQHLTRSLMASLLRENVGAGDVVAGVRVWMLYNFMFHAMAADLGLGTRQNVAVVSPQMERAFHQDSWLKVWNVLTSELVEFLSRESPDPSHAEAARTYAATILKRAATAGLSLTFSGDIRARLFAY